MNYNEIAPSYFDLMNLRLLRGRLLPSRDKAVAVVSESAARGIWPGEDPIGKMISISRYSRRRGGPSQAS
jgi:hypothetical protein